MERVRQFFSAILAGMLIGMGGTVFLSQSNPVVGSFFIRHRFIYHCGVSAASVYREGWLHALQQACVSH